MKKKISWKTFAGLAVAAGTWLKLAGDFPILPLITPPGPPSPPELPGPGTECPTGFYRKLIEGQWRCWPKPSPLCGPRETPKWDDKAKVWRCVPKGLL